MVRFLGERLGSDATSAERLKRVVMSYLLNLVILQAAFN